jgi:hypothetical protein
VMNLAPHGDDAITRCSYNKVFYTTAQRRSLRNEVGVRSMLTFIWVGTL